MPGGVAFGNPQQIQGHFRGIHKTVVLPHGNGGPFHGAHTVFLRESVAQSSGEFKIFLCRLSIISYAIAKVGFYLPDLDIVGLQKN